MQQFGLVKSPREKNSIETSNAPAQNTPKKTIIEPRNVINGSGDNNHLRKSKRSININQKNL